MLQKVREVGWDLQANAEDFFKVPGKVQGRGGMVGERHAMQWRALMAAVPPLLYAEVR